MRALGGAQSTTTRAPPNRAPERLPVVIPPQLDHPWLGRIRRGLDLRSARTVRDARVQETPGAAGAAVAVVRVCVVRARGCVRLEAGENVRAQPAKLFGGEAAAAALARRRTFALRAGRADRSVDCLVHARRAARPRAAAGSGCAARARGSRRAAGAACPTGAAGP